MAQYQSFPDACGDSRSLEKLEALRLPALAGLRFLDVGCNEGFFCGYASFAGAAQVTGIDSNPTFVARAARRFADCEFLCQSWDVLPPGRFDVILLASSLHYASDQEALIHRLMDKLEDDGTLVLELGIVSRGGSEWVEVKRGIDSRLFPTMARLREILEPYAWKHIGPSVQQAGDPVARHVVHVRRRRPYAILLLTEPASGKSSLARFVFGRSSGPKVISGDHVLAQIASGKLAAPAPLKQLVETKFSILTIGDKIRSIFARGLAPSFLELLCTLAKGTDFVLDCYVPPAYHLLVADHFRQRGYFPIAVDMGDQAHALTTAEEAKRSAKAYVAQLTRERAASAKLRAPEQEVHALPAVGTVGFAESVRWGRGQIVVEGWAVHCSGNIPEIIAVRVGDKLELVREFQRLRRLDVQRHFNLATANVGFRLQIPDPFPSRDRLDTPLQVLAGNRRDDLSGPFRIVALSDVDEGEPEGGLSAR